MQQAEQERAERARGTVAMETQQDMSGDMGLGDQGSESSISDMPVCWHSCSLYHVVSNGKILSFQFFRPQ